MPLFLLALFIFISPAFGHYYSRKRTMFLVGGIHIKTDIFYYYLQISDVFNLRTFSDMITSIFDHITPIQLFYNCLIDRTSLSFD